MSKIRRRRHGKTRDGRLLWRMKTCLHLLVTKGQCGHHVLSKNDGCPTKRADEILANPNSDIGTLFLVKCTRYKEFVRHPTVFFLQIVDPVSYVKAVKRPKCTPSFGRATPLIKEKCWILEWKSNLRKFKVLMRVSSVFAGIRDKIEIMSSRSFLPEFKWRRKMHKVRDMAIGNARKYCRRVNRFKQALALRLLKDKYGRFRL